jgi:CheY-like chemotaxis protein
MDIKVLFVEDNLYLIYETAELLFKKAFDCNINILIDYAEDIPEAWYYLCKNSYSLIVIDVMLPAWEEVPKNDEGIFLAKWIVSDHLIKEIYPKGNIIEGNRNASIAIITSRNIDSVRSRLKQIVYVKDIDSRFLFINRIDGDAYESSEKLFNAIQYHISIK